MTIGPSRRSSSNGRLGVSEFTVRPQVPGLGGQRSEYRELLPASWPRRRGASSGNRAETAWKDGTVKGGARAIALAMRPGGAPLTGLPWRAT
jgi:hypothetical protein